MRGESRIFGGTDRRVDAAHGEWTPGDPDEGRPVLIGQRSGESVLWIGLVAGLISLGQVNSPGRLVEPDAPFRAEQRIRPDGRLPPLGIDLETAALPVREPCLDPTGPGIERSL